VARELLAEQGAAGVTISAVARRLQIVPSALYRYVSSRDELLATLTADAFNGLAETLESAVAELDPADPVEGLRVAARTWRRWALEHPTDFGLVFGAPVPGFAGSAAAGRAAARTGALFTRLLAEARAEARGSATGPTVTTTHLAADSIPELLHDDLTRIAGDPVSGALLISGWVRLHGHLITEMFGHLPPVDPTHRAELFDLTIELMLKEAGLEC
jgi:AcrR family transcriptional regulator